MAVSRTVPVASRSKPTPSTPATTSTARRRIAPQAEAELLVPLLRVFVPGKPVSTNHMYGNRRGGYAKRLTTEARQWRDDVATSTLAWRFPASAPRPELAVSLAFIGCRADVDNLLKLTLDGLKTGLAVDDRYFLRVCAEKRPRPRVAKGQQPASTGVWITVEQMTYALWAHPRAQ